MGNLDFRILRHHNKFITPGTDPIRSNVTDFSRPDKNNQTGASFHSITHFQKFLKIKKNDLKLNYNLDVIVHRVLYQSTKNVRQMFENRAGNKCQSCVIRRRFKQQNVNNGPQARLGQKVEICKTVRIIIRSIFVFYRKKDSKIQMTKMRIM